MSEHPTEVRRPLIPRVFYALVSFVVTARFVLLGLASPAVVAAVGGCALVACLVCARAKRLGTLSQVALTLSVPAVASIAAALLAGVVLQSVASSASQLAHVAVSRCSYHVVSDPTLTSRGGWLATAETSVDGVPSGRVWVSSQTELERGEVLTAIGRFSENTDDDWGSSSGSRGIAGTVRISKVMSRDEAGGLEGALLGMRRDVVARMNPDASPGRALLTGVVCGERSSLKRQGVDALFSTCGISHLIAVSGSHLVVVAALMGALLKWLGLRPRPRGLLLASMLACYVVFTGGALSAVRSWAMCVAGLLSGVLGRRSHSLTNVSVVSLGMCLLDPTCACDLGFLLSVSSVVGLALFDGYARCCLVVLEPRRLRVLHGRGLVTKAVCTCRDGAVQSLSATLVAQTVTSPLVIETFAKLSLVAPLANVVVVPLVSAAVALGILAAAVSWIPLVGPLLLSAACVPCDVVMPVVRFLSSMPMASIPTALSPQTAWCLVLALATALLVAWPEVTRGRVLASVGIPLALVLALFVRFRFLSPARIVVLDVGQGDAILVQDGANAVLIDTGPDASVVSALARERVLHLDAILITHLHADHIGGIEGLVGTIPCGRVLMGEGVASAAEDTLVEEVEGLTGSPPGEVERGDVLRVGGFDLEVVWPQGPTDGSENRDSVCLRAAYDGPAGSLTAYLTGDAEKDETASVISAGDIGDVDLLKVGHHGSRVSLEAWEAGVLNPEVSVASAGEGNSFGHPTQECVSVLEEEGSRFLCTKDVGDVEVTPGRTSIGVRCVA